jgi:arabinofuranosyltransferase
MVFSLAYIWWIGGDFMAGRFLAIPVLISVLILTSVALPAISTTFATVGALSLLAISASMGAIPVSLTNPQIQRWDASARENSNVVDERSFYVQNNRDLEFFLVNTKTKSENPLIAFTTSPDLQIRTLNELNAISRNWPTNTTPLRIPDAVITECGLLGTIGLAIGPRNHLIDSCALTDRFLSGIPFEPNPDVPYKPGHFERSIPTGYPEAIAFNNPELVLDPAAREQLTLLWEKIRL